jgi:Ergosterol biosynthesis ERG4/ERG24 family
VRFERSLKNPPIIHTRRDHVTNRGIPENQTSFLASSIDMAKQAADAVSTQAEANSTNGKAKFIPSVEGKEADELLDSHGRYVLSLITCAVDWAENFSYEFGGPLGVTAMMIGFPILMYYLWICLWFYDGKLIAPKSIDDIQPFLLRMWGHVRVVSHLRILDFSYGI